MLVLYTITINPSSAILEEAKGIVTEVADGDTITAQSFGEIPFADVDCQKINTSKCLDAKAYTEKWLIGRLVYLDVDDKWVKDKYGCYVNILYLSKPDGSIR
jgi:endonuclease YncB( thermonuclease family)